MTQSNNNPGLNPANNDTLIGMLRHTFTKMMQGMDNMLPAKIIGYDRDTKRAEVQLLIMIVGTDGSQMPGRQIASVPVFETGGGGFVLSFNYLPGDLGWVHASDRDISIFLQNYSQAKPNSMRIHNFSQGVFYPHVMTGYEVSEEDLENAVLQNLNGTVKISLGTDTIKITAPNVIISESVEIDGDLSVNGDLAVSGRAVVQGDIACGANITAAGDITPNTPIP